MPNKRVRERVQSYRERMRARGLRPVQIWVPDTRTAKFRLEAHRQSLAVARSPTEREDQSFIDALSDLSEA
jgi:DNA-binding LacI/PurR family transcriptional regulator